MHQVELASKAQMEIVRHAPNLKSLIWRPKVTNEFSIGDYRQVMSQWIHPHLQDITVTWYPMTDKDISLALEAMTNASVLDFMESKFLDKSYRSLMSRHSATLRVFVLTRRDAPTGTMVQAIMANCPSLEVLNVSLIRGEDLARIDQVQVDGVCGSKTTERIVLGKDWVCLRLKPLFMQFELSESGQEIESIDPVCAGRLKRQWKLEQEHSFRQLNRLIQLESLTITYRNRSTKAAFDHGLDLRLESRGGWLDKLVSLKRLESFWFCRLVQDMGKEEIDWMLEHWPRLHLNGLVGVFSENIQKNNMLNRYVDEQFAKRISSERQ
ncbi:hypothetical protein BGX26_009687 [Mortierella sp. AD094]|nr:hypothetical protein BGX26_009687 [Mortierella sp. AD094]